MGIAAITLIYTTAERLQIQIIRILFDTPVSVVVGWVCNRAAVVDGGVSACPHIVG